MRTKTTILTAAIIAAGVASSMAQSNVYSVNIVGYVNVPVVNSQFFLLSNPLDTGNGNSITNVLPLDINNINNDSWTVYTYSQVAGLQPVETFIFGLGWSPGTNVLAPGTGFYLVPAVNTNVTFVGNVTLSNLTTLLPNFNLVGSAYPAALSLQALGLPGQDGDTVFRFDNATGSLDDLTTFVLGVGWSESVGGVAVGGTGGPTNGPTLNVGEGFFYLNANEFGQNNETWTEAFTVN
jgi:hypothetical protein